jgi:ligand-binding sensor domain-containing protein/serine phosphatase RsbU (regulator of sigma subunit)
MNKNMIQAYGAIGLSVLLYGVLFFISSCSKKSESIPEKNNGDTYIPPISILITDAITPLPDTCPAPQTIITPTGATSQTIKLEDGKLLKLAPPEIKASDFLSIMQNYNTDNGLPLDGVRCAIMDKMGNFWFGTGGGGISRYDGKSFTNYRVAQGLANNDVWSILQDRNGNIWIGTNGGGVSRYDGKSFKNYTTTEGLAHNFVMSIAEDKSGNLWFGTWGGLSHYVPLAKSKSFTNYTTADGLGHNGIWSITEDNAGNIWFGTNGGGVSCYEPSINQRASKTFKNYTTADGLINNVVMSIKEDKVGNLWFGTNNGVSRYDPSTNVGSGSKTFTNYTTADKLPENAIYSIAEDKTGNIWFGTWGGGVCRYNPSANIGPGSEPFRNYTTAQGLANNSVLSITEDKSGNIWFGTDGGGLSRYEGESFTNYTMAQGLPNNVVTAIMEDKKGNIWFGTWRGVSCYDGKSFTNYTMAQGLVKNSVWIIAEDKKGNIWFGTDGGGVSCYDGKSFTNYTTAQGLVNNGVRSIIEDKSGNLWFGTYEGVSRYDGKSFTNYPIVDGLTASGRRSDIRCILEDRSGNLWFGTNGTGVSRYDPSEKIRTGHESFTNYTTDQGLANNIVMSIMEDRSGNLWFGTTQGLSCLPAGAAASSDSSVSLFKTYTTANGLPDNFITQVVELPNDQIAVGTNLGVTIFNPKKNDGIKLSELKIFNSATGYPLKNINVGQNCMFLDSKGIIWMGTGSDKTALVRFDYSAINKNSQLPSILIQNLKINNENICWNDLEISNSKTQKSKWRKTDILATPPNITEEVTIFGRELNEAERNTMRQKFEKIKFDGISKFYPIPENLVLPYEHNNISFDFAAIEPAKPYLVRYQYKLEGYDKDWSPITNKTSATFGNIYEGTYTFKLKAHYTGISISGVEGWSEPITYTFKVLPPWWRTWWMYIIYGSLSIGLIAMIVWQNGRLLRARAKKLGDEVQKATATIVEQNILVEKQKEIVEERNKNITHSINYALRIQQAFLPSKEEICSSLPESFILFKPKDIVSGDFYFFYKKEQTVFIAAVDCTGHGVPGAFMSIIGAERLADAVSQSNDTSEILSRLNRGVKKSLHQSDMDESTRDGMDIAICTVDTENRIVKYAGANRPLWIIRKGQKTLEEIKATRRAIGGLTEDDQQFDTHKIQLQQGDTFYLCTDGYADQFSNTGKKLTTTKMKDILIEIQDKSMPEQEAYLEDFAAKWTFEGEQTDDILIIGVRL